ncbi:hypothetical protein IW492_08905 [Enterococcus sp. BWB1-3]|uniref:GIY-YIG nuclease family protein n=1 Tax=Enterococcus sp. BWB1-3 TaxID=2787713 RepID=UPI0019240543|nr:hypothetical protein [Enterococcus sp. BWB1-3]MBL1229348.1 hypothetical protein [Enterococcus sp. BWB1-3]
MGQNLFNKFNELAKNINVSTFSKAKKYLNKQGFEYKKISGTDADELKELKGIGIYIFVFTSIPKNFSELWNQHKLVANKMDASVSPINPNRKSKIMYIGKTTKQSLSVRVKKHFLDIHNNKRTGSMKLGADIIINSGLKYECHVFEIEKGTAMSEPIVTFLEQILHEQLQPRIGRA